MIHSPGILLTVLGFVAVIGPLVTVHELGHYLMGRLFGVKVDAFSIGMGRELVGWTDARGTRWKLSALPIGGYVKFAGDMGPASEPDPAWLALPAAERAKTLAGKPVWQRFLVVLAGPATNFLVAIAILAGFFAAWGVPQTPPVLASVLKGSAAEQAGLRVGDRIVAIAGRRIDHYEDLQDLIRLRPRQRLQVDVERAGHLVGLIAVPKAVTLSDEFGNKAEIGQLGVLPGRPVQAREGPVATVAAATTEVFAKVRMIGDVIGQLVTGQRSTKDLGGPLKIAQFSGERLSQGWLPLIDFIALISINLGFVNLLPIPLLDGGHLMFYAMEGVRRRPLPARAQEWAFRSGLFVVLAYMLFVTANDLASFGLWRRLAGLIG